MVGLAVGPILQRGLVQGVSHKNGAELGLERPYGEPYGCAEGRMENRTVRNDSMKLDGVWVSRNPHERPPTVRRRSATFFQGL